MKKAVKILMFSMLTVLLLTGCAKHPNAKNDGGKKSLLQQEKKDLLANIQKAVAYSGFREGQHPDRGSGAVNPSYEETLEDLKILSKNELFKLIRVYDCDENSQLVLKVIKENKLNIKVLLGMWLDAEISNHEGCPWLTEPIPAEKLAKNKQKNLAQIEKGIELANKYKDIVVAVNVGNEMLVKWNDHMCQEDTIIAYVKRVKSSITQPVTVAENSHWWADHGSKLSKVVDFMGVHVYPLWEGQGIDTALAYSIANLEAVRKTNPNTKMVITEAGWATIAKEFGERSNEANQKRYFNELFNYTNEMNITTFFFEAFDEPWKGETDHVDGAEKHWGIFNVDRTPKLVMKDLYPELKKN